MKILSIETSCDETAASLIETDTKQILSDVIYSQIEHSLYGGIVPDIAAKTHLNRIESIVKKALLDSSCDMNKVDKIAVTSHPGLIGSLLIGSMFAKGMAIAWKKPIFSINHLYAHALIARMFFDVPFPYICLLISGGHTQIMLMESPVNIQIIGKTLDDSSGECFDKVARMIGLEYPGGPLIEKLALCGDPDSISFPIPLKGDKSCNFSFSGLKTSCMHYIKKHQDSLSESKKCDIAASFQKSVALHLLERIKNIPYDLPVVIAGGVAANQYIVDKLSSLDRRIIKTPIRYCADNAVMVGWAAYELTMHGLSESPIDFQVFPS